MSARSASPSSLRVPQRLSLQAQGRQGPGVPLTLHFPWKETLELRSPFPSPKSVLTGRQYAYLRHLLDRLVEFESSGILTLNRNFRKGRYSTITLVQTRDWNRLWSLLTGSYPRRRRRPQR